MNKHIVLIRRGFLHIYENNKKDPENESKIILLSIDINSINHILIQYSDLGETKIKFCNTNGIIMLSFGIEEESRIKKDSEHAGIDRLYISNLVETIFKGIAYYKKLLNAKLTIHTDDSIISLPLKTIEEKGMVLKELVPFTEESILRFFISENDFRNIEFRSFKKAKQVYEEINKVIEQWNNCLDYYDVSICKSDIVSFTMYISPINN